MNQSRPDTQLILAGLKDFQRGTVEYVFRRLYLDDDCARRFLVADEVGLGKTLVARGVIAKTIDHLWDRTDRIDIVYVCSNADIARQNIQRLNVTGRQDVSHASRITLLPLRLPKMDSRLNFVSFTPGTSFDLKSSGGIAEERALLFWMLRKPWSLDSLISSRPFEGWSERKGFQYWLDRVAVEVTSGQIHQEMAEAFVSVVNQRPQLRKTFQQLLAEMPPRRAMPDELRRRCLDWIGTLRRILAETCLRWLEPDLIILDEFQRFKHLLQGDADGATEAAQLAEHLFSFQQKAEDPETAARVLLLSATPYKMYTQNQESTEDDHYEDFQTTLDFLLQDKSKRVQFHDRLREYRQELFRLADNGIEELMRVKKHLEGSLREVMVRTERLALKADRNGMLVEVPASDVSLKSADVEHYLGLQRVAEHLGHADVLEYWKSAPYLLNFMEDYDLKRKLKNAVDGEPDSELARCVHSIGSGLLNQEEMERYQKLDPANARLRSLHHDTIGREAWKLLWISPSLPYYEGAGPFANPDLQRFTKRLVFSSWRVVPKAIASVLSYEAERCMMQRFRKKVQNTAESRKRRRALLRFTFSKGRPTGMPVLAMMYPCRVFADRFDPLQIGRDLKNSGQAATAESVRNHCALRMRQLLSPVVEQFTDHKQPTDERWYWAAPLLLDMEADHSQAVEWFKQPDLADIWSGDKAPGDNDAAVGWSRHVDLAKQMIQGTDKLGSPPEDLAEVLSVLALAAPGNVSLRALERILPDSETNDDVDIRSFAGQLAHSFLHLFNLPEVMYLLRDRKKEVPYWHSVLDYCLAGNLQAVMDEFAHMLVESLGLISATRMKIATDVSKAISDSLSMRTSTAKADVIKTNRRRVRIDETDAIRIRTRFAMRFGDQDAEESAEPTRADAVRSAFNSPFWPFVLATTSVGQEGLDFHPYCHAVVHWNLPSNPVDLEQREGRVHRYKGHALRKNIATTFAESSGNGSTDPWAAMFFAARASRSDDDNDLYPFWVAPNGDAKIERHVPALPHSREQIQKANLGRSLVLYRMVFGQNRQEDLLDYLANYLAPDLVEEVVDQCRIDLSPPVHAVQKSHQAAHINAQELSDSGQTTVPQIPDHPWTTKHETNDMNCKITTLDDICERNLLSTKWLVAPSHRVGHQWVEKLVRNGQSIVNLHIATVLRLALEIVGADLVKDGLTLVNRSIVSLVVDSTWDQLNPRGYLGRLERSTELSMAVFDSLLALRLAGCGSDQIAKTHLESEAKAEDIKLLLSAYEAFLNSHKLVDEADVLGRAIVKLSTEPMALGDDALVLLPDGIHVAGLEKQFVEALHPAMRIEIRHPAEQKDSADGATDIRLLANIGKAADGLQPKKDGSVQLFRAVGEINEVREVLRRTLAEKQPLDEVEILHSDAETYVPLFFGTARRHFSEPDRPDGVPVTFAEGIPASLSRPGRALTIWLHWIGEGFPQRLLVEMIGEGLLNCADDESISFSYLASLLRPVGIGLGADQYLPKLDELIKAMGKEPPQVTDDGDDNTNAVKAHERRFKGFKAIRKLTKQLLALSQEVGSAADGSALQAVVKFLNTTARSISELDRYATEALIEQIEDRRLWLVRLGVTLNLGKWLGALPAQTRVLGSGPRPGHLHVAHISSGGHSGRNRVFVVGLDDRRFPGAALQDPVLLDRERTRLSPELPTSATRLRQKIDEFAITLSRLAGSVTLSWPCQDLTDDRETFPSSAVLSVYRLISGHQEADLQALNNATSPPISFAPTTAEKSLNESERWLWRLSDENLGTNQISQVEPFFPHLARGSAALLQRSGGFGAFNGNVPQAGKDLNPFATDGPVLSASALETFGRCPLAFFFRNGLKLYRPEELDIDPDRWIDAAQFGSLLHDVFRRFLDELSSAGQRPQFERDHTRLAKILQEAVEQWRKDVPPPNENAFRMQNWQLIRTARIFLQVEEEFCQTSQPRFFEVALGLDGIAGGSPLDEKEPTSVTLPSGRAILARGQVDRVDETESGGYSIWDYKIGSGYGYERGNPFRQGRRVQSVLYLRMIETAVRTKLDAKAIVEKFGYFFPSIRAHGLRIDWDAKTLSTGMDVLERICAAIEAGAFIATDTSDDCCYCDYASICRNVDQVTSHSKTLLDRNDLVPLKNFRELRRD